MNTINLIEDMRQSITEKSQFFAGGSYYSRITPYKEIISVLAEMVENGWRLAPRSRLSFEPKASSYEVRTRRSAFNFLTYDSNYASTAFYFSELSKARTLLEAMAGSARKIHTAVIPQDLKTAEEALLRELSYLDRRWEEASKKGEKAIKDWQQRKESLKKQIDELINILRKINPRYAALHYHLPVRAEDLPLKENEVLFEIV